VQDRLLEDDRFLNYLQYLRYWKKPEYFKYLFVPKCLDVLELLLKDEVRRELIKDSEFVLYLDA